jgi:UPF0271 protein
MHSKTQTIDLNLDAGEDAAMLANGREAALYELVSSVNIACGGHTGNEQTMRAAVRLARACQLSIGAHPSYPDRAGFGRLELKLEPALLTQSLLDQLEALARICDEEGVRLAHVKPHGALYNVAAFDRETARAFLSAVTTYDPAKNIKVFGLAGTPLAHVVHGAGFEFVGEAFVDRRYEANGQLRARSFANALIDNPADAAEQAVNILEGRVRSHDGVELSLLAQTLCIHGDTPNALETARAVRGVLDALGVRVERR